MVRGTAGRLGCRGRGRRAEGGLREEADLDRCGRTAPCDCCPRSAVVGAGAIACGVRAWWLEILVQCGHG